MTPQMWMENLAAYSLQVAVLIPAGAALVYLFRLKSPRVLLAFWQALLALCLLLPAIQPWRQVRQAIRGTSTPIVGEIMSPALPAILAGLPSVQPSAPQRTRLPTSAVVALVLGAGASLRLIWLALGLLRLHWYRNRSRRMSLIPDSIRHMQWRVGVAPDMFLSPDIDSPVTYGWRKPAVLFPDSFAGMIDSLQRPIACHELLHVERRDWLYIVGEEILRSLLWFHPAIWWVLGRVHLSREQVVDREVLRVTGERGPYLESLLQIASLRGRPAAVPAPLLLKERHLVQRVALMLKESTMSRSRLVVSLAAISALLLWTGTYAAAWFPLTSPPSSPEETPAVAAPAPAPASEVSPHPDEASKPARSARTSSRARAQEPMRVGSALQESRLIRKVNPVYPPLAKDARVAGLVVLDVDIDVEGIVTGVRVVRGHPLLDQAAMDAVKQWRYSPTMLNGVAVPVRATVTVNFNLGPVPADPAGTFVSPSETPRPISAVPPMRVGGNVQEAKLVKRVEPVYPELAKRARVSGIVMLEVTANEEGVVTNVRIIRGHPLLDQAAVEAVKQWRYSPTYKDGVAVPVVATATVIFNLGDGPAITRLNVDASGNVKRVETDEQGYMKETEGPVPFDKIKENNGSVQVSADSRAPLAVLEQTMKMLQAQGIQKLQFAPGSAYVYTMGRVFCVAAGTGYQITSQTMGADPAVQAPQFNIDLEQLAEMAKASGRLPLRAGASTVLLYTIFVNEVGEILAVQSASPILDIPEITTALSQARVVSPGRRGNQPVPAAVTINIPVK